MLINSHRDGDACLKGFVPTPKETVDAMVGKLFRHRLPRGNETVLDPGCGTGAFIEGIIRFCEREGVSLPRIVGVESDPAHLPTVRGITADHPEVIIRHKDFLGTSVGKFDYIIGNPPYVPITRLTENEKRYYRAYFRTAFNRFDLYMLFFERALNSLEPGGRLVFITPEKYLYVHSAAPLRTIMADFHVEEIDMVEEGTFGELVTYPTITTVVNQPHDGGTNVRLRDGTSRTVDLPEDGVSWLPSLQGTQSKSEGTTLGEVCTRISCGIATGADSVYIKRTDELPEELRAFARPTLAGREIDPVSGDFHPSHSMLVPYDERGGLLSEERLGALGEFLSHGENRERLMKRTCVARKPWYAFHENPPMADLGKPKIMCKDITSRPVFVVDHAGDIIPRHTVYYLVPEDASKIEELALYLNSEEARRWLTAHCQRAANGFLRVQSQVLKGLPVPDSLSMRYRKTAIPSDIDIYQKDWYAGC